MLRSLCIAAVALAAALPAQFTLTAPDAYFATHEGNSNFVLPWNVTTGGGRVQFVHDSTVFTGQGASTAIRITGLKYRIDAIANSWSGGTYPSVDIQMSTCQSDYLAVVNTFASNHGPDLATVFSGPVVVAPGVGGNAPSVQYVDITLTTPFVYDPTSGNDLVVDFTVNTGWVGGGGVATGPVDHVATAGSPFPALASRVWVSGSPGAPTGNPSFSPTLNVSPVCDFTYEPAVGLWPNFEVSPASGASPLLVQFTDRSVSDHPAGVQVWQWDFNGDSIVDSTQQNPSFTYTTCGSYNVTLTVIDSANPPATITRTGVVVTDVVKPSFTWTVAGSIVSFTDTSTPTPTSWAWDFDGDTVVDSTLQNPVFVAPDICAAYQVSLTASRACGPSATVREGVAVAPNALTTSLITTQGFFGTICGNVFDVNVTNPLGVNIGAITACPYTDGVLALGSTLTCEMYVTTAPGGFATNHNVPGVWRKVATGTGFYLGGNSGSPRPVTFTLDRSAYLPAGTYGVAVYLLGSGMAFRAGTLTSSNGDLTITSGGAKTGLFNAAITASRPWCGTFHYDTTQTGGGAGYGYYGAGCPSSQALVSRQLVQSLPQLGGTLSVDMTNLPVDVGIVLVGLSNTASAFGPLPIDVTPIGMPGCSLRTSLDATAVVIGTGGTGNWQFAIPSSTVLVGFQLFTQTLVFDAPANPFGCVLGDAHAALVGL